jgi:hypothetical protein
MHNLNITTKQLLILIDGLRTLKYHYIKLLETNAFPENDDVQNIKNALKEVEAELEKLDVIYIGE